MAKKAAAEETGRRFRELTLKQERFVLAYVGEAHFNGAKAAKLAGYSGTDEQLRKMAYENKTKPDISARIGELLRADAMSPEEVLAELRAVALTPTSHFMTVTRDAETDDDGEEIAPMQVRLDYSAKLKALELLGKGHRLFTDKQEVSGNLTLVREYVDGDH